MEKLKTFGQTTSVKGIPRAIKSSSKFMRVVWGLCVIGFLASAIYQTYVLTTEYLSYASITSLLQYPVDRFDSSDKAVDSPAMTFCNKNPFASNVSTASRIPSLEDFYNGVINGTECPGCTRDVRDFFQTARTVVMKSSYYYGYIGPDNASAISHSLESLLVSCQLLLLQGSDIQSIPCDESSVEIVPFPDTDHYNCYTIKLPKPYLPNFLHMGVALVFHLDDFFKDHLTYFTHDRIEHRMSGMDLYLHNPTLPPSIGLDPTTLPPGFSTNLNYRFQRTRRLSEPYDVCQEAVTMANFTYSVSLCYGICSQEYIADTCGCLDYNTYSNLILSDDYLQLPTCMQLDPDLEELYDRWHCVYAKRSEAILECAWQCPQPCHEVTYETKASYAAWPSNPFTGGFYDTYIAGRSYEHHYEHLRDLHLTNMSASDLMAAEKLINDNFLSVQIISDRDTMVEYKATPKMTGVSFMSQLGGTLNLWAGITVVVIVELVEFCVDLLCDRKKIGSRN